MSDPTTPGTSGTLEQEIHAEELVAETDANQHARPAHLLGGAECLIKSLAHTVVIGAVSVECVWGVEFGGLWR